MHIMQVYFYNLIKRPCDQTNHIWVAEATEYFTYVFSHSLSAGSHLKVAAVAAKKWAKISSSVRNIIFWNTANDKL